MKANAELIKKCEDLYKRQQTYKVELVAQHPIIQELLLVMSVINFRLEVPAAKAIETARLLFGGR